MSTYLQRYQHGEHEAVWAELTALGPGIRMSEPLFRDAEDVALETMQRVLHNTLEITRRLQELKYKFKPYSRRYRRPSAKYIASIERKVGPLPLSVMACMSVVGSIDLSGYFPGRDEHGKQWGEEALPDELVFVYPQSFFRWSFRTWSASVAELGLEAVEAFHLEFAPDEYHKAQISGGAPYSIKLPNGAMDALIEYQWHQLMFVPYLRECFRWGGFPGLSRASNPPMKLIQQLTAGLTLF